MKSDTDNRKPQESLPHMADRQILSIHHHTNTERKNDISLCSCQVPGVPHSFIRSLLISSALHLLLQHYGSLSVDCTWLLVAGHPAFLFSRWWKIIFRNGLRCWQSKVIWFMSLQQQDYDGMLTPPTHFFHYLLPLSSSLTFTLFYSFIASKSLFPVEVVMARAGVAQLSVLRQITLTGANKLVQLIN